LVKIEYEKESQPLKAVWQNGRFSVKTNIHDSNLQDSRFRILSLFSGEN
jgi:hypothetical protein